MKAPRPSSPIERIAPVDNPTARGNCTAAAALEVELEVPELVLDCPAVPPLALALPPLEVAVPPLALLELELPLLELPLLEEVLLPVEDGDDVLEAAALEPSVVTLTPSELPLLAVLHEVLPWKSPKQSVAVS